MGTFNMRFNKEATPTNALKMTTDLGLCCDEPKAKCLYEVEISPNDIQDITGITVLGETANFEPVATIEELTAALKVAMLKLGYDGYFTAKAAGENIIISATSPIVIEALTTTGDPIYFVEKCEIATLCDFKVNYKTTDTTPQAAVSFDGDVTKESLQLRSFATATEADIYEDFAAVMPANISLASVVKNEDLILFELVFNAPEDAEIIVFSPLGELTAEKCNCGAGYIGEEEEAEGEEEGNEK